jgi:hypothetical protein
MKKIILLLLAAVICNGRMTVQAQTADKASLLNTRSLETDAAAVKATRDFWEREGDARNEKWYRLPEGYLAEYTSGGVDNRWVYDRKGNWVYSMLIYTGKELPEEIRRKVKSIYYDYSIGWVKEVRQGDDRAYVVHIENDKEWKDITLQDGDIRVLKAFCKK